MKQKAILFDLDGTLTDSSEGIMNCAKLVFNHFNLRIPSNKELRVIIGPPLRLSFLRFGVKEKDLDEAINVYRGRYVKEGKFENYPYEGIEELLKNLKNAGHRLFVATSKPEPVSKEILEHFGLAKYFELICGAANDNKRETKAKVIKYLLDQKQDLENIIMIGDTAFDVIGAKENNIPTIGVDWGFGDLEEMKKEGAIYIASTPLDLQNYLLKDD